MIGTHLGPYHVVERLGEGGMGEVYRARDTRLKRDVALKVLPESFATDPERLARFAREAEMLAALNHPNIAAIYGVEDAPSAGSGRAGTRALVMELVEGETLADRIGRGAIPVEEALAEWLRDLMAVAAGAGDEVADPAAKQLLQRAVSRKSIHPLGVAAALERVAQAQTWAQGNVNPQLILADLLRGLQADLTATPEPLVGS